MAPKKQTASPETSNTPRKLKKPIYASFKLQKRIKNATPGVTGGFKLLKGCLGILVRNWKVIGGIVLVYGALQLILVQGFGTASDISEIKKNAEQLTSGTVGQLAAGLTSFGYMLGTTGAGGAYQGFVVLITSLALIWTLRQLYAGERIRIRDGFYQGMFPLVPFVLVLFVVALQTLPAVVATLLFSFASTSGIIASGVEQFMWLLFMAMAILLTIYMLCSSLFALYIVTLPKMTPMRALRSARELVRHRRWMVMRRVIFLPIALVVLAGAIMIPLIIVVAPAAGYIFVFLSLFGIAIIHSYMYRLYKELLG